MPQQAPSGRPSQDNLVASGNADASPGPASGSKNKQGKRSIETMAVKEEEQEEQEQAPAAKKPKTSTAPATDTASSAGPTKRVIMSEETEWGGEDDEDDEDDEEDNDDDDDEDNDSLRYSILSELYELSQPMPVLTDARRCAVFDVAAADKSNFFIMSWTRMAMGAADEADQILMLAHLKHLERTKQRGLKALQRQLEIDQRQLEIDRRQLEIDQRELEDRQRRLEVRQRKLEVKQRELEVELNWLAFMEQVHTEEWERNAVQARPSLSPNSA